MFGMGVVTNRVGSMLVTTREKVVIGFSPRLLEVSRIVADMRVSCILWVKCATSTECKTIRIAVSTVKDSWVTALGLRPHV
jgi:hypothetical protein